jgi:RNA polymerase sigma-70 factor, ECF subfamily
VGKKNLTYETEQLLVAAMKQGRQDAYSQLYNQYSNTLYGVICKVIKNDDFASDVLQDSFVKIWKNIATYIPEKSSLFTWILNITRNTAIDFIRSKNYKAGMENQSLDESVSILENKEADTLNVNTIGIKDKALGLDEKYSVLIEKLYFEGYTQEEAAEELGIPLGTVKTRVRTAIIELRRILKFIVLWILMKS